MAAPYMTPASLRAAVPTLDTHPARYSDAALAALVTEFETLAESYCAVAFTPRDAIETVTIGLRTTAIVPNYPRVRDIASLVIDGEPFTDYRLTDAGTIEPSFQYPVGATYQFPVGEATLTYSHGFDVPLTTNSPGAMVLRACRLYVTACANLDYSQVPRDVVASTADGMTNRYAVPGPKTPTGYLEIDRLLNRLPNYTSPAFA